MCTVLVYQAFIFGQEHSYAGIDFADGQGDQHSFINGGRYQSMRD